jgi:hypothetical protein
MCAFQEFLFSPTPRQKPTEYPSGSRERPPKKGEPIQKEIDRRPKTDHSEPSNKGHEIPTDRESPNEDLGYITRH